MTGIRHPRVVVGLDGSPESMVAGRWAAAEAARRHLSLHLVSAYSTPMSVASGYAPPPECSDGQPVTVRDTISEAAKVLGESLPGLEITTEVVHSEPRRVLVQASGDAVLTVVGNHAGGRLAEVLLGSVALHVSSHGQSPVAVIPPQAAPESDGPVLVGVDETGNAKAAIGYAFDEAAVRGARLDAVLVQDDSAAYGFAAAGVPLTAIDDGEEHAVLAEQLAGYREKYPDVVVQQIVVRGHPADALHRYAKSLPTAPQMIVLGSHGRGGVAGLMLGSTGQSLITRAAWPVLIVRDVRPS